MIKPTRNKIRICWEKYINNLYHKELRSITHKELLQISKEKTTNPTEKLVQEIDSWQRRKYRVLKHMKRSTIFPIREQLIKTILRYHFSLTKLSKTKLCKNSTIKSVRENGIHMYCWWEYKLVQSLSRTVWKLSVKIKVLHRLWLSFSLLGIDHRKIITHVGNYVKYIHCNMFVMAKDWKQFAN